MGASISHGGGVVVRKAAAAAAAAVLVATLATSADAADVKSYDANATTPAPDPTSAEGGSWLLSGVTPANVGKAPGSDAGGNYWQITDTNTNPSTGAAQNNSVNYQVTASGTGSDPNLAGAFTDPGGWTFSSTIKVLDSRTANAAAGTAATWIDIRTDPDAGTTSGRIFSLGFFNNDPNLAEGVYYVPNGSSTTSANLIRAMDLDGAFHTFDMVFTRDAADSANNAMSVYIDGETTPAFTILESAANTSGVGRVQWGSAASGAAQTVQYQNVTFSSPIPEPASSSLLALAGAGLLGRRRARREA